MTPSATTEQAETEVKGDDKGKKVAADPLAANNSKAITSSTATQGSSMMTPFGYGRDCFRTDIDVVEQEKVMTTLVVREVYADM